MNKQESSRKERRVPVPEDTRDAKSRYADIIDLEHHVSAKRPRMDRLSRAAQFSPFAALTGYDAAIVETARLTDQKRELSEDQKQVISKALHDLQRRIKTDPGVTVTFFQPDERKSGGGI